MRSQVVKKLLHVTITSATDSDNDSCVFALGCDTCTGETGNLGTVVDNDSDDDGVCDADEIAGCQDTTACNYNVLATDDDDSCIFPILTCETCSGNPLDGSGTVVLSDDDGDGICNNNEIADVKIQQHVTITRTQRMMMILVFLLMVFVRLVQVRPMEQYYS